MIIFGQSMKLKADETFIRYKHVFLTSISTAISSLSFYTSTHFLELKPTTLGQTTDCYLATH